jgi:hypothetical protein
MSRLTKNNPNELTAQPLINPKEFWSKRKTGDVRYKDNAGSTRIASNHVIKANALEFSTQLQKFVIMKNK